jgi:hypothetical protein
LVDESETLLATADGPREDAARQPFKGRSALKCSESDKDRAGSIIGRGIEYPAVSIAITEIEKRLKIDRELRRKLKQDAKLLNVEI